MEAGTLDVSTTKSEFPALRQTVAGKPLTYLDSAATTQRPACVLEAVDRFYTTHNANVHRGVHQLSQQATDDYENARSAVAAWLNANDAAELVFTKGCTESLNLVAASWGRRNLKKGDTLLVSAMEHHSNIVPWQIVAQETGSRIEPIPVTDETDLDLDWLAKRLDQSVKVVCVKAVCNVTGTINPVGRIVEMAHRAGAVVVVDAAQALAHQKVDVRDWDADFVAVTAHKAFGPMGIGALYAKQRHLSDMPPYQTGGGMVRGVSFEKTGFADSPQKFEAGTPNVGGAVGFSAAIEFVRRVGIGAISRHETALAESARARLSEIKGLTIHGNATLRAGIVSFNVAGVHAHDVGTVLDQHGVAVRVGHHCCMPLMERLGVPATVRASFSVYNDQNDVDALVAAVESVTEIFT